MTDWRATITRNIKCATRAKADKQKADNAANAKQESDDARNFGSDSETLTQDLETLLKSGRSVTDDQVSVTVGDIQHLTTATPGTNQHATPGHRKLNLLPVQFPGEDHNQFGSKAMADLKYTLAQTEGIELTNAGMKADRSEVTAALEATMIAVRNIVEGSNLSEQEKGDLVNNIATRPAGVENIAI